MCAGLAFVLDATSSARAGTSRGQILEFAADMARRGNWREASFRWESIEDGKADPYILNNLGVAAEALGQPERALDCYRKAVALAPGDVRLLDNLQRSERFWKHGPKSGESTPSPSDAGPPPAAEDAAPAKGKGKTMRVTLELPLPPRLDTTGYETLLVASFLADDNSLLDVNRELVRFLRGKLGKDPDFDVLDVTPAPAVPEQRLEELIANSGFWKHLGREYGADLIVSGAVDFDLEDYSGFEEVDRIDPTTGQKVRESEFVERERFIYALDLLFMSGETGGLVHREHLQRTVVYRGSSNDPLTAFHDLTDALAHEMMGIVEPRTREDVRVIFKR